MLGEEHPATATSYNNLAVNLNAQGKYAEAAPLLPESAGHLPQGAGRGTPRTATSYNNLAGNLNAQGKYAEAAPLYQKALAICRKVLGEEHPATATSYNNLAINLKAQGQYAEAEKNFAKGAEIFERARLRVAGGGLERAAFASERSPLPRLAAVLARNGKPAAAWDRFEQNVGRGAWDDLSARLQRDPAERAKQNEIVAQLKRLDLLIQQTIKPKDTPELQKEREKLLTQQRELHDKLAQLTVELEKKYGPIAGQIFDRASDSASVAGRRRTHGLD